LLPRRLADLLPRRLPTLKTCPKPNSAWSSLRLNVKVFLQPSHARNAVAGRRPMRLLGTSAAGIKRLAHRPAPRLARRLLSPSFASLDRALGRVFGFVRRLAGAVLGRVVTLPCALFRALGRVLRCVRRRVPGVLHVLLRAAVLWLTPRCSRYQEQSGAQKKCRNVHALFHAHRDSPPSARVGSNCTAQHNRKFKFSNSNPMETSWNRSLRRGQPRRADGNRARATTCRSRCACCKTSDTRKRRTPGKRPPPADGSTGRRSWPTFAPPVQPPAVRTAW
jgi:hypothetical protein